MSFRKAAAVLAISLLSASVARAQTRGPEITVGIAAAGHESYGGDASYTWLSLNEHFLRLAFYVSPKVAIEPDIKLDWWSGEGDSHSQIGLGAFVPIYLNGDYGATGFYVAPGAGINMYSDKNNGSSQSRSQMFIAAEAGKKFKITEAASFRAAVQYYQDLENDDFDKYTNIGALFGLSLFFK